MQPESRPIYYAAAGDLLSTYQRWREGRRDERQTAATYSGQFFDLCIRSGRKGIVSFPAAERSMTKDGRFVLRSRRQFGFARGLRYYVNQLRTASALFVDVVRSNASDVVVMDGVTSFFMLAPLAWTGRRIFLSVHTAQWRDGRPGDGRRSLIWQLDRWFFRNHCAGCLAVSAEIATQLRRLADGKSFPIMVFTPLYDRADFARFAPPPTPPARPLRMLFAGRVEIDKGVFDLLRIVRSLIDAGRDIYLDYCGDGSALPELRKAIERMELADRVSVHGNLERGALLDRLEHTQIVVVPTRSSYPEGLNKVIIEAMLARRPVVTSAICPASALVSQAAVAATADDVESYRRAIAQLIDDPAFYAEKVAAGAALREAFFNPEGAWTTKAAEMLAAAQR